MKHPFHLIDLVAFKKVSSLFAGNYKTSFHGSGIEFAGIREYVPGDDTGDIDWKTSARTGKVSVKKYEEDRERKVLFAVDTGTSMQFGSGEKTKEKTLSEVFSLLLFSSAENNDPTGAWFFSDVLERGVKVGKGVAHIRKIHDDFQTFLGREDRKQSVLSLAIQELFAKRIKNHLIFILSDSLELPEEHRFRSLSEQNDCIFIHIFDSFENTLEWAQIHAISPGRDFFIDTGDGAKKERYIQERTRELEQFRHTITKLGASYLALDESKNVYQELYLFFKKRQNSGL